MSLEQLGMHRSLLGGIRICVCFVLLPTVWAVSNMDSQLRRCVVGVPGKYNLTGTG